MSEKYTESQKNASLKYAKEKLKRIPLDVQKEKYEEIKSAAEEVKETVNGYIKVAINERMERQKGIIGTESQYTSIATTCDTNSNDGSAAIGEISQTGNTALPDRKKMTTNEERSPFEANGF